MATTLNLVTEGYCEFCGDGPTCGICGRDDARKGGHYREAQLSFLTASVLNVSTPVPHGQRCGGGIRVMRKNFNLD